MIALQGIFVFLIFLGVVVTVHESGHFFAAKWAGVRVVRFSIGFGPKLFGFRRGETEYQIAWVPLGGYVQMAGMAEGMAGEGGGVAGDEEVAEDPRGYMKAPWWKRVVISVAGPVFNLAFPLIVYFFLMLGDHSEAVARAGAIEPGSPAEKAGLLPGDVFLTIDGKPITRFGQISDILENAKTPAIPLVVERKGERLALSVEPKLVEEFDGVVSLRTRKIIGISAGDLSTIIGVEWGSKAEQAGLKTFDRIIKVNGVGTRTAAEFTMALKGDGPFVVTALRTTETKVGGVTMGIPTLVEATLELQPGEGFERLGLVRGDVFVFDVEPGSAAAGLGLKRGDRITQVDGLPVVSYFSAAQGLNLAAKRSVPFSWRSADGSHSSELGAVKLSADDPQRFCMKPYETGLSFGGYAVPIVAGASYEEVVHYGPLEAAQASVRIVPKAIEVIARVVGNLFTGGVPTEALGGPIQVFTIAVEAAKEGPREYFERMASISINLGLFNLLPIPIFDGFNILSSIWEGIRRRPLSLRTREVVTMIGLVMVGLLFILAFRNDIARLIYC